MAMELIELDNNYQMTVEQTLERAKREGLKSVIIVGLNKRDNLALITSDMEDQETFWALSQAARAVMDG